MDFIEVIFAMISVTLAFMVHEYAHGYFAYMLGDPTPKYEGRLSLNPVVHLDPIGSIVMLISIISFHGHMVMGWGKPVRFDEGNLKNPKIDGAIIALAGPFTNFVLVLLVSLVLHLGAPLGRFPVMLIAANLGFGLFNCLPVPPLDGWKILRSIMPDSVASSMQRAEQKIGVWGVVVLLLLSGPVVNPILVPIFSQLMMVLVPSP